MMKRWQVILIVETETESDVDVCDVNDLVAGALDAGAQTFAADVALHTRTIRVTPVAK